MADPTLADLLSQYLAGQGQGKLPPGYTVDKDGNLVLPGQYNSPGTYVGSQIAPGQTIPPGNIFKIGQTYWMWDGTKLQEPTAAQLRQAGISAADAGSGTDPAQIAYEYASLDQRERESLRNLEAQYTNMGLDAESARRQALATLIANRNNTAVSTAQTSADIAKQEALFAANPRDTYAEALYRNQVGGSTPFGDIQNSAFGTYGKALADKAASIFQPVAADMNQLRQYRDSIPPVDFFGPEQRSSLGLPPTSAQTLAGGGTGGGMPAASATAPTASPAAGAPGSYYGFNSPEEAQAMLAYFQKLGSLPSTQMQTGATPASGMPGGVVAHLATGGTIGVDPGLKMLADAGLDSPLKVQQALGASQGDPMRAAIQQYGQSPLARQAMALASHGLEGTYGGAAGDSGQAIGPYQIRVDQHPQIDAAGAADPMRSTEFMSNDYNLAAERVMRENPGLWESDPAQAAALTAFYAEKPTQMYDPARYRALWGQVQGYATGGKIKVGGRSTGNITGIGEFAKGGQIDIGNMTRFGDYQPASSEGGTNMNIHEQAFIVGKSGHVYATIAENGYPEQVKITPTPSGKKAAMAAEKGQQAMDGMKKMGTGGSVTADPSLDEMNNQYSQLLQRLGGSGGGSSTPFGGARFLAGAPWAAIQKSPFLQGITDASYSFRGIDPAELAAEVAQFTPTSSQNNFPRIAF